MSRRHNEPLRKLRLGDLRKLLRDRNGPILPDDDAGRDYLHELLLPISLGPERGHSRADGRLRWPGNTARASPRY